MNYNDLRQFFYNLKPSTIALIEYECNCMPVVQKAAHDAGVAAIGEDEYNMLFSDVNGEKYFSSNTAK